MHFRIHTLLSSIKLINDILLKNVMFKCVLVFRMDFLSWIKFSSYFDDLSAYSTMEKFEKQFVTDDFIPAIMVVLSRGYQQ